MKSPCGRGSLDHRHYVSRVVPGPPQRGRERRREGFSDRCNSQLLWATVARAVLLDREPELDGKPFAGWTKEQAWEYLLTCPAHARRGYIDPSRK